MKALMKTTMILAALLLSATFASAGDLKPVHGNGGDVKPLPTPNASAYEHANDNAAFQPNTEGDKDKVRKLRPVK